MTNCKNASVSNEVALSVNRLVTKYGHELNSVTWTEVLETLATLLEHCQVRKHSIDRAVARIFCGGGLKKIFGPF